MKGEDTDAKAKRCATPKEQLTLLSS